MQLLEPPIPQPLGRFSVDVERKRLHPFVERCVDGNGYIARIVDVDGPEKHVLYDSEKEYGTTGVFPTSTSAMEHAELWIEARLAQLERIEYLRRQRQGVLAERLVQLQDDVDRLNDERAKLGKEIKSLEDKRKRLVREAQSPQVELDFRPKANDYRIHDAPAVSDGTEAEPIRQTRMDFDASVEVEVEDHDLPELESEGDDAPARQSSTTPAPEPKTARGQRRPPKRADPRKPKRAIRGIDPAKVKWPDECTECSAKIEPGQACEQCGGGA